jgi:hypothetical protein
MSTIVHGVLRVPVLSVLVAGACIWWIEPHRASTHSRELTELSAAGHVTKFTHRCDIKPSTPNN